MVGNPCPRPVEQPLVLGTLSTDPRISLKEQIWLSPPRARLDLGQGLQGGFRSSFGLVWDVLKMSLRVSVNDF